MERTSNHTTNHKTGSCHTFPRVNNSKTLSAEALTKSRISHRLKSLRYGRLRHEDRVIVQSMHNEWFPIKYEDSFFWAMCCPANFDEQGLKGGMGDRSKDHVYDVGSSSLRNLKCACGCPNYFRKSRYHNMMSLGAFVRDTSSNSSGRSNISDSNGGVGKVGGMKDKSGGATLLTAEIRSDPSSNRPNTSSSDIGGCFYNGSDRCIACIVSKRSLICECRDQNLVYCPDNIARTEWQVEYLMTLGTHGAYRRSGLATELLSRTVKRCRSRPLCKAVYLHVVHYNESAQVFYKRNGFELLRRNENFYTINGQHHDSFIYILYMNGARPAPQTWVASLQLELSGIWSDVKCMGSSLLNYFKLWGANGSKRQVEQNETVLEKKIVVGGV